MLKSALSNVTLNEEIRKKTNINGGIQHDIHTNQYTMAENHCVSWHVHLS